MIDDDLPDSSPIQSWSAKLRTALRSGRHRSGLVVFALALLLGVAFSMLWLRTRPVPPAIAMTGSAVMSDPTHPPLPAPMPGALSTLPPPATPAPGAAFIAPTPATPEPEATDAASAPTAVAAANNSIPATADTTSTESDSDPKVIQRTQPEYPSDALRAHEEGEVRLQVAVDALGNVEDVRTVGSSGSRTLDRAAMTAVHGWRFLPAHHAGEATSGMADVTVEFRLDEH